MKPLLFAFNERLFRVTYWLTAISCLAFLMVVLLAVGARYVAATPILGGVELSRLAFIWSCFLGACLGYRQRAHIALTFLTSKLAAGPFRWLEATIHLLSIGFFVMMAIEGIRVAVLLASSDFPMLGISQSWLYWPVPVAMTIMICFGIEFFIQSWTHDVEGPGNDALGTDH